MKKKIKSIIISLVVIVCFLFTFNLVEKKVMLSKLINKYEWAEPLKTVRLGRYNGCPVVFYEIVEGNNFETSNYYIENFHFSFYDYENIYLFKNNKLYTLQEAYENGFVTSNQVAIIYLKFSRIE